MCSGTSKSGSPNVNFKISGMALTSLSKARIALGFTRSNRWLNDDSKAGFACGIIFSSNSQLGLTKKTHIRLFPNVR